MSLVKNEGTVVGLSPWLPWPLSRSPWWTEPVRAERLAALRIGLGAVLLLDLLLTYLPNLTDLFGRNSLGSPSIFAFYTSAPHWRWSILAGVEDPRILRTAAWLWVLATFSMTIGLFSRTSAITAWVLSTSFAGINSCIDNAGDEIRGIILFYLMVSPCGAVWSIDRWRQQRASRQASVDLASRRALAPGPADPEIPPYRRPIFIHPWPLRLLMIQMILMYFSNGMFKLSGNTWWSGTSLYYVLADLTLARWSYAQIALPFWLTKILTWLVLVWEAGFPVWVALPWTRKAAFLFGVAFHLGIGLSMVLGSFVPYAPCLYLPLVSWERLGRRAKNGQ
jgi:hypothetical protein